jgi:hypothetical protein
MHLNKEYMSYRHISCSKKVLPNLFDPVLTCNTSLEYNCYYMTAICQNANTFLISARGAARTPRKAFAYDFNSARATSRRNRVCRTGQQGWTSWHACPEIAAPGNQAQPSVYRADGLPWWTTALEPNLPAGAARVLAHRRSNGQIVERSGVKYTCDEFPPATFIQGGAGPLNADPSYTRCAAFRCSRNDGGRDAEQNWQASGHDKLRRALIRVGTACLPNWNAASNSPLIFYFRMINEPNNIPVKIYEADSTAGTEDEVDTVPLGTRSARERIQDMRKRSLKEYMEWADTVPLHELTSHGFAVKTHHVYENQTSYPTESDGSEWDVFGHMNYSDSTISARSETEPPSLWTFEMATIPGVHHKGHRHSHLHRKDSFTKPTGWENSTLLSGSDVVPKNFTNASIAAATRIVEEALNRSAEYNKARWGNMSRNQYRLKPGTIVGGAGGVPNPSLKKRALPDFIITPKIEAAAALLTEFEASGMSLNNQTRTERNSTGRVRVSAAAAGSFWMENIARKGTVPWGNDPSYKVSLHLYL